MTSETPSPSVRGRDAIPSLSRITKSLLLASPKVKRSRVTEGKEKPAFRFLAEREATPLVKRRPLLSRSETFNYSVLFTFGDAKKKRSRYWAMLDLNQRPHPYQGCALTN
jgi:hypothetical protein